MRLSRSVRLALALLPLGMAAPSSAQVQTTAAKRPMTFLDMQKMQNLGEPVPSPDGKWALYTISTPDWKEAKRQSDIYLVSLQQGVASNRQMTFTRDKDETAPRWSRDSRLFFFLSNREAPASATSQNQVYLMSPGGGEARRVTDAKEGASNFRLSRDGRWLVYRSGKSGEEQLYRLPVDGIDSAKAVQLTKQPAGIGTWEIARDSKRLYLITADSTDTDDKLRREKKFTANLRNPETPLAGLWAVDLDPPRATRLAGDSTFTVQSFNISDDAKWVGFQGIASNRYQRNITEQNINGDLYLLEVATGKVERLTQNDEVGETGPRFSPDGKWVAFSAPDNLQQYSMTNQRVYLRAVADRGKPFRKLDGGFDGDVSIAFWSSDGQTIYFNEGIRATNQFLALDLQKNTVRQLTQERAAVSVSRDDDAGVLFIQYSDGRTPNTLFTVASVDLIGKRPSWIQLTDANPQVRDFDLGEQEEITWKSTDGRTIGGVLVKPVGYQAGRRYPLIVAIHGGPAGADVLGFNGGYGSQVYSGAGYAILRPNYRGSINYGEKHKTDIVGNYFALGYDDIMTGVDHLIAQGIADSSRMGALGWSAGGHWSNWILTHTNRFKAISTGAGTSNWISMYAESDVQRNRQFYLGNKLPYDDFEAYWNQSPLKYIKNAKTPTMIHVVEGDPRVPSPQSIELHMALKRLGVPTEFFMYPGSTHGIPDARNQLVKAVAEMAWMDHYVRGTARMFAWRDVLKTLDDEPDSNRARRAETSNAPIPEQ